MTTPPSEFGKKSKFSLETFRDTRYMGRMRSEAKQKYYALIHKHEKLVSRMRALEVNHDTARSQLAALYFLLRKVVALVPYDAPEVTLARGMLDRLSSAVDDYVEYTHDLAMERSGDVGHNNVQG